MLAQELRHERGHMPPPKAPRRCQAQMAMHPSAPRAHTGFGVGDIGQHALTVFQKSRPFKREADAPSGAYHQLDAQVRF